MTEEFVAVLKKLISDRGIGVLDDARICRSLLLDYGNEHKREIKLFTKALESNFPVKLRNCSNRGLDKKQMAKSWYEDDGFDIMMAEKTLNCLCHVLFGDTLEDFDNFTDPRDDQVYRTVKIGNQIWMAENFNYNAPGSKFYYNDPKNAEKYGRLYDWETAMKVAPSGWHLPSDAEWQMLVDFAGGSEVAGTKLKAKNGWNENGNGTDDYSFSTLPGGDGNSYGNFSFVGYSGVWWSSSESNASNAWCRNVCCGSSGVYKGNYSKSDLFSVRCLKN